MRTTRFRAPWPWCLAASLLLCCPASGVGAYQEPDRASTAATTEPDDATLRRAFRALSAADRAEVTQWFLAEAERLDTFQNVLLGHLFGSLDRARYDWPEATPPPCYDAARHCPAQPIVRTLLDPDSAAARRERVNFLGEERAAADPSWSYDWARGSVVRHGDRTDPQRVFDLALRGSTPDQELARAIVLSLLDPGTQRAQHAAFGHVYSDRLGKAVPGVTLYDAWTSGRELEMPDVECLGVLHDLTDDWTTFVAPVPTGRQQELYARIRDWYTPLGRERGLREALAATYLGADPQLGRGYGANLEQLHGLWERARSMPRELAGSLPEPVDASWDPWWEDVRTLLRRDPELWGRARGRQEALRRDQQRVRALLVGVLREWGALGDGR